MLVDYLLKSTGIFFFFFCAGLAAHCKKNIPMVQQIQVGFGKPPTFMVVVQNSCPMCPAIDVHLKCAAFTQSLVDPRVFRVVRYDDCVVGGGLPLAPLQKISFNYTHEKFILSLKSWSFQCEWQCPMLTCFSSSDPSSVSTQLWKVFSDSGCLVL